VSVYNLLLERITHEDVIQSRHINTTNISKNSDKIKTNISISQTLLTKFLISQ
jgi:hypothetical protein